MTEIGRRELLVAGAAVALDQATAQAGVIEGRSPWQERAGNPPRAVTPEGWVFFAPDEAQTVEAIVDRIIPPDPETPGGKDCGCAVFIDRQLAGAYGSSEDDYRSGPFKQGTSTQGAQLLKTPSQRYRSSLSDLNRYCRDKYNGRGFAALTDQEKDAVLKGMEDGTAALLNTDGKAFFKLLLKDTKEGFFSDPIYGGNRNMASWRMIGFPGARYDYRDWIGRHNERYPHPPVSIAGSPEWTPRKA